MRRHVLAAGLVLLGASGCVTVTGPRAIRPGRAGMALRFETVDTLSPSLEWEPVSEADAPARAKMVSAAPAAGAPAASAIGAPASNGPTSQEPAPGPSEPSPAVAPPSAGDASIRYDVAVHEVIRLDGWRSRPGARVYYREALAGTSHRVEVSLAPGRDYYWFVRARRGSFAGPWSRFGYFVFFGVGWMSASNQPYRFRTPGPAPAREGEAGETGAGGAGGAAAGAPAGAGSGPPSFYQ